MTPTVIGPVYSEPGGAVSGEHLHPVSEERFTLVRGKVAFLIGEREVALGQTGQSVLIQPGIKHRWWNCGGEQAFHICEFRKNSDWFEQLVLRRLFGLAQDGRITPEGRPRLLQQAVTTLEFGDVVRFTSPPWAFAAHLVHRAGTDRPADGEQGLRPPVHGPQAVRDRRAGGASGGGRAPAPLTRRRLQHLRARRCSW